MVKEYERVIINEPIHCISGPIMQPGDIGVVVDIVGDNLEYTLEFFAADGCTVGVGSAQPSQIRAVTPKDVLHARVMQESPATVS